MSPESTDVIKPKSFEAKVTEMIAGAGSMEVIISRLEGMAMVVDVISDDETGYDLEISRIIGALKSNSSSARADECPLWLNRALTQNGYPATGE